MAILVCEADAIHVDFTAQPSASGPQHLLQRRPQGDSMDIDDTSFQWRDSGI
jgi:hypothetical protein